MKCPECHLLQLQGSSPPVKEGYLLLYKKRIFSRNWKPKWVALYEDSTVAWYKNKDPDALPLGYITLTEIIEMIASGDPTVTIPGAPSPPRDCTYNQMIVFGDRSHCRLNWFFASNQEDFSEWTRAFTSTLKIPLPTSPSDELYYFSKKLKDNGALGCIRSSTKPSTGPNEIKDCRAPRKMPYEIGTGLLLGTESASVACGQGLGWNMSGLSGTSYGAGNAALDSGYNLGHLGSGEMALAGNPTTLVGSSVCETITHFDVCIF